MSEKTRAYIYRIVLAVIPLLVVFGVVSEDQVTEWVALAAAVLGTGAAGLATGNTSTHPDK